MSINKDRNIIKRVVEIFNVYPGVDIRQKNDIRRTTGAKERGKNKRPKEQS